MQTGRRDDRREFALYATSRMVEELGDVSNAKNENHALYIGVCDEGDGYFATYTSRKYEFWGGMYSGHIFSMVLV